MDPPHGCRPWRPCLLHHPHHHLHRHHHHHHHPLFLCPHHHHAHHHHTAFNCHHHHVHPSFATFPQNSEQSTAPAAAVPFPTQPTSETSGTLEEQNYGEVDDGGFEEEEDDDPVFVLTDEWKELFAKSEAKRKLAKQQAKKAKNAAN